MKIGILTFHFVHNSGALLQCWALQEALKTMGHEVYVINYMPKYHTKRYSVFPTPLSSNSPVKGSLHNILSNFLHFGERVKRKRKFDSFQGNFNLTEKVVIKEDWDNLHLSDFDAIVCGSDQIWNCLITNNNYDKVYFGLLPCYFGKRVAYAVSTGEADLKNDGGVIAQLAEGMSLISAREQKTAEVLSSILQRDIKVVPDPTFLIQPEKYDSLMIAPSISQYILVYCLEDSELVHESIEFIRKRTGLQVVNISPVRIHLDNVTYVDVSIGPNEFLGYIANAEYVITNSFHGSVFSILFNKQFFTILHSSRGLRIKNLLEILLLEKRIVMSIEVLCENFENLIDYEPINAKIAELRQEGLNYLKGI